MAELHELTPDNPEFIVPDGALLYCCLADWQLAQIWWMLEYNATEGGKCDSLRCIKNEDTANYRKAQMHIWQAMLAYDHEENCQRTLANMRPSHMQ